MSEKTPKPLTEAQQKILDAIEKNDVLQLKSLLSEKINVNFVDGNLMSPLQHAAYKGNKEIVQLLLDQGADVNFCEHQHNYTALHFAGLSGNREVVLALLLSGAKTQETNTVGRTAAQMAAFVGHHNCVAVINNYIPKSEVDYYTRIHGLEMQQYLMPFLSDSLHKFIMEVNIHPVKVVLNLQNLAGLADHLPDIKKVVEMMCEKEMKRGPETNETMAFKFHYLAYTIDELLKFKQKKEKADDKKIDVVELFIRNLLKPGKDGHLESMDAFIKECIREFPYRESTLFRQMVTSLTGLDPPSALSIINAAINGQKGFIDNISVCSTCGEEKPAKKCSKCKAVQYCDRNCQRLHWHWHKKACQRLSQGVETTEAPVKPDAAELSAEIQNLLIS
ncbi:unnamed protein product [Acanthoscelides obtectus]|uniref:MYND-type domain-containing protein n=2 Tax=Acanthoscelides obtectus TaxID=200917 RepID=A0A9P0LWT1_ACAOB|nr:unnamed protein product [Acanthoscelides obtectus]CAK1620296.1 Ankyrin repeat and MYND domain-containing protein 2 [Acanthoscelides obtectus]